MTQPNPADQQKAGFFRAGTVALWVWIVLAVIPVVAVVGCRGLCGLGSVVGGGQP